MLFVQESIESATTSAALKLWRLTSRASSDVLHFGESRDRIRTLEQDVMTLKGHINVAKSKEKSAMDVEAFILHCLNATNQQLESKTLFFSFFALLALVELILISPFVFLVIVTNPIEEKKRVDDRLNALQSFASSSAGNFWNSRDKGLTVVIFQDRVEQARKLLIRCRDCIDYFHNALFPLNPCPDGLVKLLDKFKDGSRILKFIHREMISGAWSTLSWVKDHHPQVDLDLIAEGLPENDQGEWDMRPFYDAAFEPARKITSGFTKNPGGFDKPKTEISRRWLEFQKL